MKEIQLTRGQVAIVDDGDYEWLNSYKWRALWSSDTKSFYATRTEYVDGKRCHIAMHRQILGLTSSRIWGDHRNHDTLDYRRHNLRVSNRAQNASNSRLRRDNVSGLKGAHWHKRVKLYGASITVNRKQLHLGYYPTAVEAHEAYKAAAAKYHGEFACA